MVSTPLRRGCARGHRHDVAGAVDPASEQLADHRHAARGGERHRAAVAESRARGRRSSRRCWRAPRAVPARAIRLPENLTAADPAPSRSSARPVGSRTSTMAARPVVVLGEQRVFRAHDEIRETDGVRARRRLSECAAAIRVHARAIQRQRRRTVRPRSTSEPIRHADVGIERGDAGVDVQRQPIDVERRRSRR